MTRSNPVSPGEPDAVIQAVRAEISVEITGAWKHGELPDCFEPIELGSFVVSYAKRRPDGSQP